jgi:predicted phage-related endonuclease
MERIPKPKHGSKEWLLTRWRDDLGRCVFGASDIPALMNASPYKTRANCSQTN